MVIIDVVKIVMWLIKRYDLDKEIAERIELPNSNTYEARLSENGDIEFDQQ